MPPRRSTRASLPTPSASSKAESIASTPGMTPSKIKKSSSGFLTPSTMDEGEDLVEVKQEVKVEIEEDGSSASGSTLQITRKSTRVTMEAVTIPGKRSKLSTVKTTSADNLTLHSPISFRGKRDSSAIGQEDPLDSLAGDEPPTPETPTHIAKKAARSSSGKVKPEVNRPDYQPFNVGKYSRVKKEDASSLAFDSESDTKRGRAAKGKAQAKMAVKVESESEEEEEEEPVEEVENSGDDFAMDSDEEEKQLQKAIKASKASGRVGSSSKANGRATAANRGRAVGGRANGKNARALRAAVARAAQTRVKEEDDGTPFSLEASTSSNNAPAPSEDAESEFKLSEAEESDLSSLSEAEEAESDYLSSESEIKPKKKKAKTSPRKKTTSGAFKGKGQRLDGGAVDSGATSEVAFDPWEDDYEGLSEAEVTKRKQSKAERNAADKAAIQKAESKLKQALGRKLTNGEKNLIRLERHHEELDNVWGDLAARIEPVIPIAMEAHPSLKLTLLPFQKESLFWMKKQEEGPWKGGMLADEMGMGKTIQTIALLLSEPRRKPSLVVAPVVALMQWKHEIETHAEGFTVCLWHGQGRMKANELKKFDVVLSSYGTLEAAFRRQQRGFKKGNVFVTEKSPLHVFEWHRVILDEAHNIKERSTNAAKAAFALSAKYRWCLSGTPLQNRVGELYSLVRFLGAEPFSQYFCKKCDCKSLHWQFKDRRHCDQCGHKPMDHVCFWNTEILTPIARYGIESGNPGHTAFKKLKILLDRMMLRRTKIERADDLGLPPRTIVVRRDYFSPEEKELYMSLFSGAKRQFATYIDQGTVLNNYSNIFSLITRMRQMACHPDLVLRSKTSKLMKDAAEGTVCRICNDQAEDAIMSQCKHVFDRECIKQYLEVQQLRGHRPECPVCHIEITIDLEAEAIDLEALGGGLKARQGILSRLNLDNWRSSSKLEALVEELHKLREKDCTIKSLVFSQFVSFLDLIAFRLQRAGFTICRLEGGMTPQQRDATIQHFMNNTNVTVFLISLKAGGVALNLTEASMVFMMDSWWNPSVEYQAMDRIHRLGQHRPVKVVKLVVEDSIEDQIVALQAKKLAMTDAALSKDPEAALGKLTVEDLGFLFKM